MARIAAEALLPAIVCPIPRKNLTKMFHERSQRILSNLPCTTPSFPHEMWQARELWQHPELQQACELWQGLELWLAPCPGPRLVLRPGLAGVLWLRPAPGLRDVACTR